MAKIWRETSELAGSSNKPHNHGQWTQSMKMTEIRRRCSDGHHSNQFVSPIYRILSFNARGRGESSRKEVGQRWNFRGLLLTLKSTARMASSRCHTISTASPPNNAIKSFWLLGVLNNSPWVLMLAVATNISSGGVALVVSCSSHVVRSNDFTFKRHLTLTSSHH